MYSVSGVSRSSGGIWAKFVVETMKVHIANTSKNYFATIVGTFYPSSTPDRVLPNFTFVSHIAFGHPRSESLYANCVKIGEVSIFSLQVYLGTRCIQTRSEVRASTERTRWLLTVLTRSTAVFLKLFLGRTGRELFLVELENENRARIASL